MQVWRNQSDNMGLRLRPSFSFVVIVFFLVHSTTAEEGRKCDFFTGEWQVDLESPLYNDSSCSFLDKEFSCLKNGRPDSFYTVFRWKPLNCDLLRFNGEEFMENNRGKKIMFVGDSLSKNQWLSLACMLSSSLKHSNYSITIQRDVTTFTFMAYQVNLMYNRNVFLIDVMRESIGRVLDLDSINGGKLWKGIDVLIFNTWHWWNRRGPDQPWDFIKIGNKLVPDMDRLLAFQKALQTWAQWIETNVDPSKVSVYFQGISPSHYNGTLWNQPVAKNCEEEKQPVEGPVYPGGEPVAVAVLKGVLENMTNSVTLLDVTLLSLFRKDGHPSIYGIGGRTGADCSHWCLPGVPDTWNEILFNYMLLKGTETNAINE